MTEELQLVLKVQSDRDARNGDVGDAGRGHCTQDDKKAVPVEGRGLELLEKLDPRFNELLQQALLISETVTARVIASGDFDVKIKGASATAELDIATAADREIDQQVRDLLINLYPNYSTITEESGPRHVENPAGVTFLDSLDETTNFKGGGRDYGTLVAVFDKNGHPEHALIQMIAHGVSYAFDTKARGVFKLTRGEGKITSVTRMDPLQANEDKQLLTRADRLALTREYLPAGIADQVTTTDKVNLLSVVELLTGRISGLAYTWKARRGGGDWDIAAPAAILKALGGEVFMVKPGQVPTSVKFNAHDPHAISDGTVLLLAPGMREKLGLTVEGQ